MPVWTNEKLIEFLSKQNPKELVYALIYAPEEVGHYDDSDFEVDDTHWNDIVYKIGSDYAEDTIRESFGSAMGGVLKDYECDTCYKHSYEVKEIDGMKVCPYCGEEPDFLDK